MIVDVKLVKTVAFLLLLALITVLLVLANTSYGFVNAALFFVVTLIAGLVFYAVRLLSRK